MYDDNSVVKPCPVGKTLELYGTLYSGLKIIDIHSILSFVILNWQCFLVVPCLLDPCLSVQQYFMEESPKIDRRISLTV